MPSGDQRRGSLATGEWRRDGRSVRAQRLEGSSQIGGRGWRESLIGREIKMPSGDQRRGSLATGEWRRDG